MFDFRLRYLTFSSVRAVFGRPLPGFRSVADPHSSTLMSTYSHAHHRVLSLSIASNPFPEILQQLFGIQKQVSAMCRSELYPGRYFAHNQSYGPNCDYDLKY